MNGLLLSVLGPVAITRDGERIAPGGPKQAAVLAALVVERGRAVTTDRLVDLLWDEDPPPSAVATLQAYVSNLRRLLEPLRSKGEASRVLLTRGRGYVLDLEPASVDAFEFERLASGAHDVLSAGRPAEARAMASQALARWNGEPYAGVPEPFARVEAARLRQIYELASEDLIEAMLALGDHDAAVPLLESAIAAAPLRERLRGQLMLALYRSGRQAEALAAYRDARRVLSDELGIEPGPALRALEADILAQSAALDAVPVVRASTPVVPAPPSAARLSGPMVGRDAERDRVEAMLDDLAAGAGRTVVVFGEAGAGKTRLAEEISALAADRGLNVVWGRCLEVAATAPYWPWTQILRALNQSDALGPAAGPSESPVPIYEAVANRLLEVAARAPMVIVLDDVHWADAASLELLRFFAAAARGRGALIVATHREMELNRNDALRNLLGDLARETDLERVAIHGLDEDGVGRLIAARAGIDPAPSFAHAVFRRTDGNPFFVSELLRLLAADGVVPVADAGAALDAGVPLGVRDVVGRHVSRLPAQTIDVLEVAATIGREFEIAVLERAAGRARSDLLDMLETAIAAGIVESESPMRFRFVHDIVRHTIDEGIAPIRRARLNAHVADALTEAPGESSARTWRLAHHLWHAAAVRPASEILPVILDAAHIAERAFAFDIAAQQYDRALELYESAGEGASRGALEAATLRVRLRSMINGYAADQTKEALTVALSLAERADAPRERAVALWGLWGYCSVRTLLDDADRYAARMLAEADERADDLLAVAGHLSAGVTALHRGLFADSRMHLERGLALSGPFTGNASDVFQQDAGVACRSFLAALAAHEGRDDDAVTLSRDALLLARSLADPFTVGFALMLDGWVCVVVGRTDSLETLARELLGMSERFGFRLWSAFGRVYLGLARALQGEGDVGEAMILQGLAELQATGTRMLRPLWLGMLAQAQRAAGRRDAALITLQDALEAGPAGGELFAQEWLTGLFAEPLAALNGSPVAG